MLTAISESFKMRNVRCNPVNPERWSIATNAKGKFDALFPARTVL